MKREGRIHKGVSIGAYSILIAFMLLLLWTVLRYPGNHLIPWQMAPVSYTHLTLPTICSV